MTTGIEATPKHEPNWLQRVNRYTQIGMHLAVMFFFISLGTVTLTTIPVIRHIEASVTDINRVVLSIGGTAAQLRKASEDEAKQLKTLTDDAHNNLLTLNKALEDVRKVIQKVNTTVGTINTAVDTANKDLKKIEPVLAATQKAVEAVPPVLNNLGTTTAGLSNRVNDPNLPKIVASVEKMTADGASMTNDGKQVTAHYRELILKPLTTIQKVGKRTWNGIKGAATIAGKFIHL